VHPPRPLRSVRKRQLRGVPHAPYKKVKRHGRRPGRTLRIPRLREADKGYFEI
jgi:hypothetical protein